jgi:hypothetical protein
MRDVIRQRLGLSPDVFPLFMRLAMLAMLLTSIAIVLETLSTSLFLAEHGVSRLPFMYLILAVVTVPVSFGVERLLEVFPVRRMIFWLPVCAGIGVALAAGLGYLDIGAGSFLGILISQLYTLLLFILFWVLVSSFVSEGDIPGMTPGITIAILIGGILGAFVTIALVRMFGVLPGFMMLVTLCFAVALETERSIRAMTVIFGGRVVDDYREITSVSYPDLVRENQMIRLLSVGTLLFAICYGLTEYVVFGIYVESYPVDTDLAGFLAFVFAGIQVVEVVLVLLASRALVNMLGPTTRNLVFPALTFLTVGTLALFHHLVTAVVAHVNYRSVFNSVLVTVNSANFAAIPRDYINKVRLFGTGLVFPAGLAVSAFLLIVLQGFVDTHVFSLVASGFAACFLVAGVLVARAYLPAVLDNMEAGVLDLNEFRELPAELEEHARGYLQSSDELQVQFGLEILARGEVRQIVDALNEDCRALSFSQLDELCDMAMARLEPHQVARVLEVRPKDEETLYTKLKLALGCGGTVNAEVNTVRIEHPILLGMWDLYASLKEDERARILAAVGRHPEVVSSCVRSGSDVRLVNLVLEYIEANPASLREYQGALLHLAEIERDRVYQVGLAHIDDRRAWRDLLGIFARTGIEPEEIDRFTARLKGASRSEERQIYNCLSRVIVHPEVLELLDYLVCSNRTFDHLKGLRLMEHAPRFIRQRNVELLFEYYRSEWDLVLTQRQLTPVLAAAVEDFRNRTIQVLIKTVFVLDEDLAQRVRRSLESDDQVARINAVEAIAAVDYLRPIARLLQRIIVSQYEVQSDVSEHLAEVDFEDFWLRTAKQKSLKPKLVKNMDHILFLKEVKLFSELDFDSLQALNELFEPHRFGEGDAIFKEGDAGHHLFLVEKGTVRLESGGHLIASASQGDFFGEMALIDESPRSADAICTEDCTLLTLERRAFEEATEYYPQILRALNSLLAERIRELNAQTLALQKD